MNKREHDVLWDTLLLHPFSVPDIDCENDRQLEAEFSDLVYDVCGGMLCDEPGLGNTITMLALILLTKWKSTKKNLPVRVDPPTSHTKQPLICDHLIKIVCSELRTCRNRPQPSLWLLMPSLNTGRSKLECTLWIKD
ncbi:hypothetical protein F441_23120 [Phytophthora nicotianae CJ01A1]|nr:hypothetical protein F441_23120 [Phytophthora nicotianae CJ01A1]